MQEGFNAFVKMIYVGIVTLNNAFKLNFVSFLSCPNRCHTKKSSNLTKVEQNEFVSKFDYFFHKDVLDLLNI